MERLRYDCWNDLTRSSLLVTKDERAVWILSSTFLVCYSKEMQILPLIIRKYISLSKIRHERFLHGELHVKSNCPVGSLVTRWQKWKAESLGCNCKPRSKLLSIYVSRHICAYAEFRYAMLLEFTAVSLSYRLWLEKCFIHKLGRWSFTQWWEAL